MTSIKPINLAAKFSLFQKYWSPRIVGELNSSHIKLAKLKGEFEWHQHANEDEMFLVVQGNLKIQLRDGEINMKEGELAVIPKGVEHLPIAVNEVHVMLIEPKSTVNTGEVNNERTANDEWI